MEIYAYIYIWGEIESVPGAGIELPELEEAMNRDGLRKTQITERMREECTRTTNAVTANYSPS